MPLKHLCPNCFKLTENPWSLSQGFCTYQCLVAYDEKAEAAGGYHILVRDLEIAALRAELRRLLSSRQR